MRCESLAEEPLVGVCPKIGLDEPFAFECGTHLDCFTRCCADVSIVLAPYDIIRLKRALGIDSTEFLDRYTISPFTKDQKIPIVMLRMEGEGKRCPFVSEAGCGIYSSRPWACRMYPLGAAEPRNANPENLPFHFLVQESICHGHGKGTGCTVREWLLSQGVEEYDAHGASFKELMLHQYWDKEQPLDPKQMEMYFTACYDIDKFRRFVFETRFLELFEVDEARVEAMRTDDEELLEFAMQWLRFSLFHEKTMKISPAARTARRDGRKTI